MLAFIFAAALAGPVDVAGTWNTPVRHGLVEITHCGASICGRLITSDGIRADPAVKDVLNKDVAMRGRSLKGVMMLDGFHGGPTEWTGGRIYNPQDGGTYHATVTVTSPNELKVQGCIFVPLCKTQVWTRATRP